MGWGGEGGGVGSEELRKGWRGEVCSVGTVEGYNCSDDVISCAGIKAHKEDHGWNCDSKEPKGHLIHPIIEAGLPA